MEQCSHCITQEPALCSSVIQAAASLWLETHFLLQNARRIHCTKLSRGQECNRVVLCFHKFNGSVCLDKPTSKSTSGRQLHPQKGPWIFSTGSLCSFATMNLGENGCHCCRTYPTVLPGGAWISSWVKDCGEQSVICSHILTHKNMLHQVKRAVQRNCMMWIAATLSAGGLE